MYTSTGSKILYNLTSHRPLTSQWIRVLRMYKTYYFTEIDIYDVYLLNEYITLHLVSRRDGSEITFEIEKKNEIIEEIISCYEYDDKWCDDDTKINVIKQYDTTNDTFYVKINRSDAMTNITSEITSKYELLDYNPVPIRFYSISITLFSEFIKKSQRRLPMSVLFNK